MKKSVMLLLAVATLYCCSEDRFFGSGDTISEIRNVEYFDKVSSEGTFEVIITKGNEQSVEIIADNNILHRVKTDVINGKLKLELENGSYNNVQLEAHITILDVKEVENTGSGKMLLYDITNGEVLKVINSGSANIFLDGSCEDLIVDNEGSGSVFAFDMLSIDGKVNNRGSGDIEVTCGSSLNVDIEGSGNVYYHGNPTIQVSVQGSGSLINDN